MDARGAGLHRLFRIDHHGEVCILHLDHFHRRRRFGFGSSHHHRNLVAHKADHIRAGLCGTGSAQHGLVLPLQAILVDRHILRRVDGNNPRGNIRFGCVDAQDTRVWSPGKQHFHMQHAGHRKVARIRRRAGYFPPRIYAGQGFADRLNCHYDIYLLYRFTFARIGGTSSGPYSEGPRKRYKYPKKIAMNPTMTTAIPSANTELAYKLVWVCKKPRR
jgi:hypothetical protein